MAEKHPPTDEQQEVIQAVAGRDSVMVQAFAGCAKSTTLEMAAPQIKVPAMATAFNKKIATDLASKLPSNFSVKTFNSLGLGAWIRANPQVQKWEAPDPRKTGKLVSQVAKDRKCELSSEQWDQCRALVSAVMVAGITPQDQGRPLHGDTLENWQTLADRLWIPETDFQFLQGLAHEVLEKDIELAKQGKTSFDDQVYCSALLGGKFPQFPVTFVDESQDLSPLNHRQLELGMRPDGRLVVVGDPLQAIYAFRGAHAESMGRLRDLRQSWTDRGLATTFRCPKVIVTRQQGHAQGFKAWHTNPEGRFARLESTEEMGEGWEWQDVQQALPHPQASVAVLCRNNGPLLSLAFKLLAAGTGVVMLGRDIGKGLITLSRKLCPEDATPAEICRGLICDWRDSERSLALANGQDEKVAGIEDRAMCLLAVISSGHVTDAGQLRAALEKLFAREAGAVSLGSIHRAKGLEWDVVLHLDPWRIPSKWAKEAAKRGDTSQLQQECNLRYVAETRTKHTLLTANLEDFQG